MIEIDLDGQKVSVPEGSMVMHAADAAGTYIPHFCYHKKLSIAANCRMCLVEIEKAPKPMPACATPVTQGMIVRTRSDKALNAQQGVMEFLLINHPLDCPICDQGGECQLQDLAVGYGASSSRYDEDKRVVFPKDVGPLISMKEMNRCIHCTRCVRFGQEVAGVMELGMIHRGEHSEITTIAGDTIDSELSGNMIDICPVGALTSKPFRYSARTWELSRRKSVSPHDSTGANLIVQVKGAQVMRVVPLENEDVNECWLADRDRFSYEAFNSPERLTTPMIRQGGQWKAVDWTAALDYVSRGLTQIIVEHGPQSVGALASPISTVEELFLLARLVRGLGSENIDTRLREAAPAAAGGPIRWLGQPIAALSELQRVLVVGSFLRKDHPLFAQRLRQAAKKGAKVMSLHALRDDWLMPMGPSLVAPPSGWLQALADIAAEIGTAKGVAAPAKGNAERRRQGDRRGACQRHPQGDPARQRRRAASRRRRDRAARPLDRRADRRQLRLAGRRRQRGRRPARRCPAGRGRRERRAHARHRGAAQGLHPDERRARPRCRRWRRRGGRARQGRDGRSRSPRSSRRPATISPTCCCRSRPSPRPRAPSSTARAGCRASTASSSRAARRGRHGRCCACSAICSASAASRSRARKK